MEKTISQTTKTNLENNENQSSKFFITILMVIMTEIERYNVIIIIIQSDVDLQHGCVSMRL